jgi:L-iditol 2-dehydrogenase
VHPLAAQPGTSAVSLADAALAEPAALGRGITRGRPRPGERIAVVGDGTVGLITAHLLRLYSPAELVVFGQREDQAGLAVELGVTAFELAGPAETPSEFDLVIEAAGRPAAVEGAIALARRGGRVVLLGLAGNGVKAGLPIDDVVNNDLAVTASFGYTSAAWAEVSGTAPGGQNPPAPLITHRFPLEAFPDAYLTLRGATGPAARSSSRSTRSDADNPSGYLLRAHRFGARRTCSARDVTLRGPVSSTRVKGKSSR